MIDKCRDCRWLTGARSSVGTECMQPHNQKIWDEREAARVKEGRRYTKVVARYKMPSMKACKRFERAE